jgi:hypothetical protein
MEGDRQTVFDFITSEINNYQTLPVKVSENYEWSMFEHIKLTVLYKNSRFNTGNSDDKPFKNIIRPILNLQYRAEGFDVKDIVLYVNDDKNYFKSFLIKKFHEKWAREVGMDTYIDDLVETYVDFGGALSKRVKGRSPEIIPWQTIAFCDQTDILAGPICIKHSLSPDELNEMESSGWGDKKNGAEISLDDLIELSKSYKTSEKKQQIGTPGRYIEVYELHGVLPDVWLEKDGYEGEWGKFTRQLQIVAFYQKEDGKKEAFCLYKGREKNPFKFISRDKIFGRALGMGGAEELFEAQVWTNYDMIRTKDLLDAASKIIFKTTDDGFAKRNKLSNLENLEILKLGDGKDIAQIDTTPRNINLFNNSVAQWEVHARTTGAAQESISGEESKSGIPFKSVELQAMESHSLHEYRKGKLATHLDEIYKDWNIPDIVSEINQGQKFLADLDLDELQSVADSISKNQAEKILKEKVLNGETIHEGEREMLKEKIKKEFMGGGNKKFIELLEDELKDAPVDVAINIVGKQKYLSQMTDKLVNVFRQIFASPQILSNPVMAKLFNQILESAGLSPMDFYSMPQQPIQLPAGPVAPQMEKELSPVAQ